MTARSPRSCPTSKAEGEIVKGPIDALLAGIEAEAVPEGVFSDDAIPGRDHA
jgi:hypothetical protein